MLKWAFLWLVVFLFVLSPVFGGISVEEGVKKAILCPRDTALFTDIVTNDDSEVREYSVNVKGSAFVWATAVPRGFVLQPKESKTIYTYVTPGKDASPGKYELGVVITSKNEAEEMFKSVEVKNCYNTKLESNILSQAVCPANVAKYKFILKNEGNYREDYNLKIEGQIKDKVELSETFVSLASGESKEILAFVNAPSNAGAYDFSVVAEGRSGKTVGSSNFRLNVESCYDFQVIVEKNFFDFCEGAGVEVPLIIKNKGTSSNSYKLEISGPAWANLDKNLINLASGTEGEVRLNFAPKYGAAGQYTINLGVIPEKGELKFINDFSLNVRKCSSVELDVAEDKSRVCNGIFNSYDVLITNNGELEKDFKIELEGPGFASLSDKSVFKLKPGENKKLKLNINPSLTEQEGKYNINIKVGATDESGVSAADEDKIEIETLSQKGCYEPLLAVEKEVKLYFDSTASVPVTITNNGLSKAKYEVVISGSGSNFIQVNPAILEVEPGKSEIAYLYIAPSAMIGVGDYEVVVGVRLEDSTLLKTEKVAIKVTADLGDAKTAIPTTGSAVGEIDSRDTIREYWNKLKERVSNGNYVKWLENYWYYVFGVILLIILIVLLFKGKPGKKFIDFFEEEAEEDNKKEEI